MKKRVRDQHTKLAATPLQDWSLAGEWDDAGEHLMWTLAYGDTRCCWDEQAAPGLGLLLQELLPAHTGTWHLARTQRSRLKKSSDGGRKGAQSRRRSARDRLERAILAVFARGENPAAYAPDFARAYAYTRRQVYNVISAVRRRQR